MKNHRRDELELREFLSELEARSNGKWGHVIENVANGMDALSSGVNIGTSIYGYVHPILPLALLILAFQSRQKPQA